MPFPECLYAANVSLVACSGAAAIAPYFCLAEHHMARARGRRCRIEALRNRPTFTSVQVLHAALLHFEVSRVVWHCAKCDPFVHHPAACRLYNVVTCSSVRSLCNRQVCSSLCWFCASPQALCLQHLYLSWNQMTYRVPLARPHTTLRKSTKQSMARNCKADRRRPHYSSERPRKLRSHCNGRQGADTGSCLLGNCVQHVPLALDQSLQYIARLQPRLPAPQRRCRRPVMRLRRLHARQLRHRRHL